MRSALQAGVINMWNDMKNPPLLERLRRWISPYQDKLNIPPKYVFPIVSVCLGYRTQRGGWGGRISLGDSETKSLYYNGVFWFRFMLPFYVGIGIRWRGTGEGKEFLQAGLGWKLNGEFGMTLRIQSDASGASGTTGPNKGQAVGWADGTK